MEGRTSLRALMTTCVPRRKFATAAECVWKRPLRASGTPSPHQLICTNLGSSLCSYRLAASAAVGARDSRWDPSHGRTRTAS